MVLDGWILGFPFCLDPSRPGRAPSNHTHPSTHRPYRCHMLGCKGLDACPLGAQAVGGDERDEKEEEEEEEEDMEE